MRTGIFYRGRFVGLEESGDMIAPCHSIREELGRDGGIALPASIAIATYRLDTRIGLPNTLLLISALNTYLPTLVYQLEYSYVAMSYFRDSYSNETVFLRELSQFETNLIN